MRTPDHAHHRSTPPITSTLITPPPTPGNYKEATQNAFHKRKPSNERTEAQPHLTPTNKMNNHVSKAEVIVDKIEKVRKPRARRRQRMRKKKRELKSQPTSTSTTTSSAVQQLPLPLPPPPPAEKHPNDQDKTRKIPIKGILRRPTTSPITSPTPTPTPTQPPPRHQNPTKLSPIAWDHSPNPSPAFQTYNSSNKNKKRANSSLLPYTLSLVASIRTAQHDLYIGSTRYEDAIQMDRANNLPTAQLEHGLSRAAALCHDFFLAEYAFRDVLDEKRGEEGFDVRGVVWEFRGGWRVG